MDNNKMIYYINFLTPESVLTYLNDYFGIDGEIQNDNYLIQQSNCVKMIYKWSLNNVLVHFYINIYIKCNYYNVIQLTISKKCKYGGINVQRITIYIIEHIIQIDTNINNMIINTMERLKNVLDGHLLAPCVKSAICDI